ncbi:MAG: hypothetical protein LBT43_16485 [Prevotella sp.]|jgi:hypothetical protein|nr:hypothetical protein [Prevotella sp.]
MKFRNLSIIFLLTGLSLLTSCLESGLDDIENSDLCVISSITMEYRWIVQNANGYDQLSRQQMTLSNKAPDENNEIHFTVTVPSANSSFPKEVRDHVSLDGLYLITVISPASKISPLNGAPKLGLPGVFEIGKDYQYEVTAANGKKAVYHVMIEDFIK